ncbi:MAG TPA: hypothetical protein VML75_21990 [Kofleriaceae bacterium]|nr:hypothetical protein [Kofleriaceae bacterium]
MKRVFIAAMLTAVGCAGSQPPEPVVVGEPASVAETAPPAPFTLAFGLRAGGVPVTPQSRLPSGQIFDVVVTLDQAAYVYVFLLKQAETQLLYPADGDRLLPVGMSRLPVEANLAFRLDTEPGTEHLFVVASARPVTDAAPAVAGAIARLRSNERALPVVREAAPLLASEPAAAPDAGTAPPPPPKKVAPRKPKPRAAGAAPKRPSLDPLGDELRGVEIVLRGVELVDTSGTGEARVRSDAEGVAAYRFSFEHVAP